MDSNLILIAGILFTFVITAILLKCRFRFLPQDHGRAYAVNGELSKGKLRGVGLVFTITYIIGCAIFMHHDNLTESIAYAVLLILTMLSGYLDDASEKPWSDYKKGIIDFVLSVLTMVVYVAYQGTEMRFFSYSFTLPAWLYVILGVVFIWMSINFTNCTDGVDGLLGSVSIVTIMSFVFLLGDELGSFRSAAWFLAAALTAYLFFNTSPSSMLMGDAGSRAIGYVIALLAMLSRHPFIWFLLAGVIIIDGSLGLGKIFLKRFFKICILKNTRTPIHDHMRKNKGWSDTQVVVRFALMQVVLSVIAWLLLVIFGQ